MTRAEEKMQRRAGRDRKPTHADVELARLRTTRIGPLFPESTDSQRDTRKVARAGKDTKPPYTPTRHRKSKVNVAIRCRLCRWSATGRTWRPVRRQATAHVAEKHAKAT